MELWSALVLGLVGSLHCAGMCGPLALALPGPQKTLAVHLAGRTAYNLGRVATYSMLGIVFGLAGKSMLVAGLQRSVSIVLGVLLLVGLLVSRRIALSRPIAFWVAGLKARMSGLFRRRTLASMALLGSLNGLLPCGLVYVAGVGAAATGNLFKGAQYMAVFGSGTFPMMLALSLSGKLVSPRIRFKLAGAIPIAGFALAALLILRGLSLGIPYLSPDLVSGTSCCHAGPH